MKGFLTTLLLLFAGALLLLGLRSLSAWDREPPLWPRVVRAAEGTTIEVGKELSILLEEPPIRVLPANAALVDMVSALVPPERIAALPRETEEYSRLGSEAGAWSALPTFRGFSAEALLVHTPDLVIAHAWQKPEVVALLRQEGIPVLVVPLPRRWEDVERTLALLGEVLDAEDAAATLQNDLDSRIAHLRSRVPAERRLAALSYTNLGSGGWAAGRNTTADVLFELAGLRNAAAGLEGFQAMDLERLFSLDPDLIIVSAARDGQDPNAQAPTAAYLYGERSLARLRAVREHHIVALPPRLFTTTSHELLHCAEELVERIEQLGL